MATRREAIEHLALHERHQTNVTRLERELRAAQQMVAAIVTQCRADLGHGLYRLELSRIAVEIARDQRVDITTRDVTAGGRASRFCADVVEPEGLRYFFRASLRSCTVRSAIASIALIGTPCTSMPLASGSGVNAFPTW